MTRNMVVIIINQMKMIKARTQKLSCLKNIHMRKLYKKDILKILLD